MEKLNLSIFLVLFVALAAVHCEDVPVFIWGKQSVTYVPALSQYKSSEFSALIESQRDADTFTAIFVEKKLSPEDLSQCKLNTQTCFKNLQKLQRKSYLQNVEEPLSAFDSSDEVQTVQVSSDGTLSEPVSTKGGNIVIFHFADNDLASHDALINELYNQFVSENSNILAVYTGKTPSFKYSQLIRKSRQAPEPTPKTTTIAVENRFLIHFTNFSEILEEQAPKVIALDKGTLANVSDTSFDVELTGEGKKLAVSFSLTQGSWEITKLVYDDNDMYLKHRIHINAPFSYHCIDLQYHSKTDKTRIVFNNVQLQPNFPADPADEFKKFGDSWDCVGFTSAGLLSGLFIVLIFILIVSIGISWMMDINTMDRFDDPKGKTITISATD